MVFFWFATSMSSLLIHTHSWYEAIGEIKAGTYRSLYQHNVEEMMQPSSLGNVVLETVGVLFSGLRLWNHWLRALGYDVLLSFLSLMVWAGVNQSDVHGMVKSSLNPWLDEAQAAVGHAATRLGDATEEMYDDIIASQPLARAKDAWSSAKEEARRRTASAMHSFAYTGDDEDDDDEGYSRSSTRSSNTLRAGAGSERSRRSSSTLQASSSAGPGRSRSRSRGAMSPTKRSASSRRSSRVREPSISRRVAGIMDDGVQMLSSPTVGAVTGRAEAVVLTYALGILGGLGMASTAVFGAEE